MADVRHTISDLYSTASIITGLIFVALGFTVMDELASLTVALIVAYSAFRVVRDAVPVLVEQAVHNPRDFSRIANKRPRSTS